MNERENRVLKNIEDAVQQGDPEWHQGWQRAWQELAEKEPLLQNLSNDIEKALDAYDKVLEMFGLEGENKNRAISSLDGAKLLSLEELVQAMLSENLDIQDHVHTECRDINLILQKEEGETGATKITPLLTKNCIFEGRYCGIELVRIPSRYEEAKQHQIVLGDSIDIPAIILSDVSMYESSGAPYPGITEDDFRNTTISVPLFPNNKFYKKVLPEVFDFYSEDDEEY